jgi:hypothetical protein
VTGTAYWTQYGRIGCCSRMSPSFWYRVQDCWSRCAGRSRRYAALDCRIPILYVMLYASGSALDALPHMHNWLYQRLSSCRFRTPSNVSCPPRAIVCPYTHPSPPSIFCYLVGRVRLGVPTARGYQHVLGLLASPYLAKPRPASIDAAVCCREVFRATGGELQSTTESVSSVICLGYRALRGLSEPPRRASTVMVRAFPSSNRRRRRSRILVVRAFLSFDRE